MISIPFYTPLDDSLTAQAVISSTAPAKSVRPCCTQFDFVGKASGTCTDDPAQCGAPKVLPGSGCGKCEGDSVLYCGPFGLTICRSTLTKLLLGGIAVGLVFIAASGLARHA